MRIVTLSTYPIDTPLHGGQHRLLNIVDRYRAAGHQVASVGVLGSMNYAASPGFIGYPPTEELERCIARLGLMDDWAIGELMAQDDRFFGALAEQVPVGVDLVHVEQPWLFRFAQRYVAERGTGATHIVYGGQNIEHALKRRIVSEYMGTGHADECAKLVLECELAALRGADLICAVSREDADWMQAHATGEIVLAGNGVRAQKVDHVSIVQANEITGHRRFALYSASAHPPNIIGFYDMFGRGVGCFAPDERIVVAGNAGPSIQGDQKFIRTPGLEKHFIAAGEVSTACLTGLLETSHLVVLPITQGSGTNLKTAEALWLGHHIVATPVAMRGFEQFANSTGVSVREDPVEFREAIREAMAQPACALSHDERDARRVVLWEQTLRSLVDSVNSLAE